MSEQEKNDQKIPEQGAVASDTKISDTLLSPDSDSDPWNAKDWQKLIPEKFRDEKGEIKIKELGKSYSHLEKKLGSGDMPPKTPEEYKIEVKLPAGVTIPEDKHKEFLKSCHGSGMTNKQVQFVMDKYGEILHQLTDDKEVTIAGLKKDWGEDFEKNLGMAHKAMLKLVDDETDRASILKVGNNPALIRLFARLGKDMQEDNPPSGGEFSSSDEDIEVLQKSKAYWDAKDPEHSKVKAKIKAHYEGKYRKTA